jgi:hypothetical protein
LSRTTPNDIEIELSVEGSACPDWPTIDIQINNICYQHLEIQGQQTLKYHVADRKKRNLIKITLTNKGQNDTVMENGSIVSDKFIKLLEFKIDGVRVNADQLYLFGGVKIDGQRFKQNGLYKNSTYTFYFENPVHKFFIRRNRHYFKDKIQYTKFLLETVTSLFNDFVT